MSSNKDFVAISINDSSYPPSAKLFCSLCNCNLILLDPQRKSGIVTVAVLAIIPIREIISSK